MRNGYHQENEAKIPVPEGHESKIGIEDSDKFLCILSACVHHFAFGVIYRQVVGKRGLDKVVPFTLKGIVVR